MCVTQGSRDRVSGCVSLRGEGTVCGDHVSGCVSLMGEGTVCLCVCHSGEGTMYLVCVTQV